MEHQFGPEALGRGIVIRPEGEIPEVFREAPRFRVDDQSLTDPEGLLQELHRCWVRRERVVVELALDKDFLKQPEILETEVYKLEPSFEFSQDRLQFLLWANSYDATEAEPVWWYERLARHRGLSPHQEAEVDLEGPVWCDGGPRGNLPFPVLHRESITGGRLRVTRPESGKETELAPDQQEAVHFQGGSARILAPAGSGKTRVLTHRMGELLERGFEPTCVTAVAYNKRAALEMQERLKSYGRLSVRTLHSLGYGLLRKAWGVKLATPVQVRSILKSLVKVQPQLNSDPLQPYMDALQLVRLGLREPLKVENESEDIPGFAEMFPRYRNRLAQLNLVDHDEQIYSAIELLLKDGEIRKKAQQACSHLLVDEFQDLTPAFLLLIRLLSAPSYQTYGVGDDDQVIYGYTGATPRYLIEYENYFPQAARFQLETNYRCGRGIVEAAASLCEQNEERVKKRIRPSREEGGPPRVITAKKLQWVEQAVRCIQTWLGECPPDQIAVLCRVNALLMPLQVALAQQGVPHTQVVDENILNRTGIRTALAYRRLCTDLDALEPEDLQDALRRPNRKLKREYVDRASRCGTLLKLVDYAYSLEPWPQEQLEDFASELDFLSQKLQVGETEFFKALRTQTAFSEALEQLDSSGLKAVSTSHQDDFQALEQLAGLCPEEEDFEQWLLEQLRLPQEDGAKVRLSSIHRVKGLEWSRVLLFGVDEGILPHRLAEDLEEERRILHVGITRAQEECAILASEKYASEFLSEFTSA